ncbi:MAG: aminopeptidase P family protein [Chloroflexi bacterium]|nr:aminopeptidase P family protein [Chloroflexota bacterium]
MNRLEEINFKHNCLRDLLARQKAEGLWLRRTRNLAWFTAGADASIPVDSDFGAYSILVTPDSRVIYTTNIEATRLRSEEQFQDLGFEFVECPWYQGGAPELPRLLTDDNAVETDIQQLRWVLTPGELERYRALGRDAVAALDEAIRAACPGDTEYELAARLDAACRKRGGLAIVNLIGTDERISQFRHPLPTMKRLDRYAMLVVCMRRHGLIVSGTRLAYFGRLPEELQAKVRKVAHIDAAAMVASQPGRTLGDAFSDLLAAYHEQGETEQWKLHHQGGPTAYIARERIAGPGDPTLIREHMPLAWNPSIAGCKSEDTIVTTNRGFEIVTTAPDGWPMLEVEVKGQTVRRPGILEM